MEPLTQQVQAEGPVTDQRQGAEPIQGQQGQNDQQSRDGQQSHDVSGPSQDIDWDNALSSLDANILRKHPRVMGIVGDMFEKAITVERRRIQEESGRKAAQEAEAKMRQLASTDPLAFTEQWLSEDGKRTIQSQLDEIRGNTRGEFASAIGRGYQELPEWKELTQEDHESLAKAVLNKPDEDVLPTFNRTALDLLANRRAKKLLKDWQDRELPKVREAIRQEEAAKLMASSDAPDTKPPKGSPAKVDIWKMTDDEFNKYWDSKRK